MYFKILNPSSKKDSQSVCFAEQPRWARKSMERILNILNKEKPRSEFCNRTRDHSQSRFESSPRLGRRRRRSSGSDYLIPKRYNQGNLKTESSPSSVFIMNFNLSN